jgi:very-short-patch-repair endonuclease
LRNCEFCKKEFANSIHIKRCSTNWIERPCRYCSTIFIGNRRLVHHEIRCVKNPERYGLIPESKSRKGMILGPKHLRPKKIIEPKVKSPYKHTDESRKKISLARIKYLKENPDKVPYLLNHYSKGPSYPEKYFFEILTKENVNFETEFRIGLYSLDFVVCSKMIDLEINGEQHYLDNKIFESDIRRKAFLENLGWSQIVVRWSEYQKLDRGTKEEYIKELIKKLL